MSDADRPLETRSLGKSLAKYYVIGLSWSLASVAVLARDLGLPSIGLGDRFVLHVDHLVIIGAVFVAIVLPLVYALVEVASPGR